MFAAIQTLSAQNSCEQSLKQAEEFYSGGDYDNSIQLLEKAIKECNLSYKKKEVAYELLAKTYLEQDNPEKAETAVFKLLKLNPQYELKENTEHEDFELLVKKFDVHPLFSIGLRNSAMMPNVKTVKNYSILEEVDYTAPYKTNNTVMLYYLVLEYEFAKNYSISADVLKFDMYFNRNFSKNLGWNMNYHEEFSMIEIPLYLKRYIRLGKSFSTYIAIGGGYLRMLEAEATADISYFTENHYNTGKTQIVSVASADVLPQRNQNTYEALGAVGVGYRFKNIAISVDARYTKGLSSLTNPAQRYANSLFINDYFYVDNSILLNKYEIGVSLSYTFKNVIKKAR